VIDRINVVDVLLSNPLALLYHADRDALAMGANAMMVGDELIHFGRALALGGGGYRLSELIRGEGGTEHAIAGHTSGETAVLLEPASLSWVAMDRAMIGAQVVARAYGVADDDAAPPTHSVFAGGEGLRPMSPCHVEVSSNTAAYTVRWTPRRRSLVGWSSSGGDEVGAASFQIRVTRGAGVLVYATAATSLVIPAGDIAGLGAGPIGFQVVELGALPSRPAQLTLSA
jgi:hypothetical protein